MKKGLFLLAVVVSIFLLACGTEVPRFPIVNTQPVIQTGDWAMLQKYPILGFGMMSDKKIQELGLERKAVITPLTVYNYTGDGKWKLETLPTGALVATDSIGRPWYKILCGNRVYIPIGQTLSYASASRDQEQSSSAPSAWRGRFWPARSYFWLLHMIGALGIILVGLVIAAILFAIYRAIQQRNSAQEPRIWMPAGGGVDPNTGGGDRGLGTFFSPAGEIRINGRGVEEQEVRVNGDIVTMHFRVRR